MLTDFKVISGTVIGREHIARGRNNQDAIAVERSEDSIIACVADGCSGGLASEVGANLGVRMAAKILADWINPLVVEKWQFGEINLQQIMETVERNLLGELKVLTYSLNGKTSQIVSDLFLFTILGAVVTPDFTMIFSWGDGVYAANGKVEEVIADQHNMPSYLGYKLLPPEKVSIDQERVHFNLHYSGPTAYVESLMIGTDGVSDLIKAREKNIPGRDEKLGGPEQFWLDPKYQKNPDLLRRRLLIANREHMVLDPKTGDLHKEIGLLPDDTSMIVITKA